MHTSEGTAASDEHVREDPAVDHSVLLGVLAHELRTPITTIYAGSAVLARDDELLPSMRRELAADVYAEAARLFRAVEDLLVLTRLEHDALSVSREPISLIRAADSAAQSEAERWTTIRPMLRIEGAPDAVAADGQSLAHALRNLIANVGWRSTEPTDLEIVIGATGERVACRLIDRTGTLEPADVAHLFDLPKTDPRPGATSPGIAMFVAAALVRAMRGDVWAHATDDGDVEIGFSLPRYEAA